jgi:Cof subfamily protein (haloacid dehalogenase superfamily)
MKPYPNPTKISLVLADVDGTLVTQDKVLTPRAKAAVAALRAAGIAFTITSGRPPLGMKMIIDALRIDIPIAGFNGGVFVQPDLTVLSSRFIPQAAAARALDLLHQHGLMAWLYTDEDWFVPDLQGPHVAREAWTVKFGPKVSASFNSLVNRAVKIVGVSDDLDAVAQCESAMQRALHGQASAARSQPYYLDVTNPQANKGSVVQFVSRKLRVPTKAIATLGDMPNDVLMFKQSGLSIAMGNASKEVQFNADVTTLSNEEDGFAYAVERFVLGRHPSLAGGEMPSQPGPSKPTARRQASGKDA